MSREGAGPPPGVNSRLDQWLDLACLFKTRSEAQRACRAGRVKVNGQVAPPGRMVKAGDELRIARRGAGEQIVVVRSFAEAHVAKAMARTLYEDRTPPPPPERVEARRIERLVREAAGPPAGAPGSRDRRLLRRLRGKGD
jgi:ribosome-associated heat shock protein Hsp15